MRAILLLTITLSAGCGHQTPKPDPVKSSRLYTDGMRQIAAEKYDEADETFHQAIEADDTNADAYFQQGLPYLQLGAFSQAETSFTGAIIHDPGNPSARNNRGLMRKALGNLDLALEDFDKAIRIRPDASFQMNRADTLARLGHHPEVLSGFLIALEADPDNPYLMNQVAWLWATSDDPEVKDAAEAIKAAEQACELSDWKLGFAISTLATAYAAAGDFDKAIELETTARELYPEVDLQAWDHRLDRFRAGEALAYEDEAGR
jgi:tetratricopeptide (TPR) repeat protein